MPTTDILRSSTSTVDVSPHETSSFSWQRFMSIIGLPCLISVAAIDPGNLEVDLQSGLSSQYSLIWTLLLASVIGFLLQTLAAHLTLLTKLPLSNLFAEAYSHQPLLKTTLFIFAQLGVIAFDLAEVIGTAFALQLLFNIPLTPAILLSAFDTLFVLLLQTRGFSRLQLIIELLLLCLTLALLYEFFLTHPSFSAILKGTFVPTLGHETSKNAILALSVVGSVVMPHNLYLHSFLIYNRPVTHVETSKNYATIESAFIFLATFFVNAAVVSISAALPPQSNADVGLKDAAILLDNVLGGHLAGLAWAIALLASGHAATVTGCLASQAVLEGFMGVQDAWVGWIMTMRCIAIVPAVLAGIWVGEKGGDALVVGSQVVLSVVLPFVVVPMLKVWPKVGGGEVWRKFGWVSFWIVLVGNLVGLGLGGGWAAGVAIATAVLVAWLMYVEVDLDALDTQTIALLRNEQGVENS